VGLTIGLVVAFLAITGSIMAFQDRVVAFAERRVEVNPAPKTPCLAVEAAVEEVNARTGQIPATVQVFADAVRPALVRMPRGETFLVDACGAHVLAAGSRWRSFFEDDQNLHRWLALSRGKHETLRALKNGAVVALLFLLLSGLVLWVPRQWRAANLRAALLLRRGLKGKARLWNMHQVFGLFAAIPLLSIILTGLMMAYPWAMQTALRLVRSDEPAVAKNHAVRQPAGSFTGIDGMLQRAAGKDPRWKSITFTLPEAKEKNVAFTIDEGQGNRPSQRATVLFARRDGHEVRWTPFVSQSRGQRWRTEVKYLHTGEIFGLGGQIIIFLAVMSALVQVVTGFGMAWKRWCARRERLLRVAQRTSFDNQRTINPSASGSSGSTMKV
jgi:uncharacterized iron-regulated membrane protein